MNKIDEIERMIYPPLIGICEENLRYRGPQNPSPGTICYAWPPFPFPILKPWQRALAAMLPRRYRWVVYWAVVEGETK